MVQRRQLVSGGMALATTAWIAPSVLTLDRVSAAVGSCTAVVPTASNGAALISAPATIAEGTVGLDSNTQTFVWLEQEAVILDNNLIVNRTTAGNFNGASNQNATILAGTEIASYYVHGDRLDDNGILTGQITFTGATILGLVYRKKELTASAYLQAPGTTYFNGPMEGSDSMSLSATSVSWSMRFGGGLDGIRVIISCG